MDQAESQVGQAVDATKQRDPDDIRQEIEQTRYKVGDTAAALAEKADVKAQAKTKLEEIKGRVEGKRRELAGRASEVTPESAGQAASTVGARVRENPMSLVVVGAAVGGFVLGRVVARR
jgi:ElaB/YqjD/DUF883 family membrane-anchored ribosome-binding protein